MSNRGDIRVTTGTLYRKPPTQEFPRGEWAWEYRLNGQRTYHPGGLGTSSREVAEVRRNVELKRLRDHVRPLTEDLELSRLVTVPATEHAPAVPGLAETSYKAKGRAATAVEVVRTVNRFVKGCPVKFLSQVRREHVDAYVAARREAVKGKTLNKELQLLRALVNRLAKDQANPFSRYGLLREDDSVEVPPLPPDVVRAYLDVATDWVRDWLYFLAYTGARLSTLRELMVKDVDLKNGTMKLRMWKTEQSVTDRYKRVTIHTALATILRKNCEGKAPEEPVFHRPAHNAIRKRMQTLARRHKLPSAHPHQIRHSWATQTLARTGDLRSVMEGGGWTKMETVQRYAGTDMERVQRVIDSVPW